MDVIADYALIRWCNLPSINPMTKGQKIALKGSCFASGWGCVGGVGVWYFDKKSVTMSDQASSFHTLSANHPNCKKIPFPVYFLCNLGNLDPFPPILPHKHGNTGDQRKMHSFSRGFLVGHGYIASNARDPPSPSHGCLMAAFYRKPS